MAPKRAKSRADKAESRQKAAEAHKRKIPEVLSRVPDSFDQLLPLTEAEMAAMPTQTTERYLHKLGECMAWARFQPRFKDQKFKLSDPETLDEVVTTYLNKLFLE